MESVSGRPFFLLCHLPRGSHADDQDPVNLESPTLTPRNRLAYLLNRQNNSPEMTAYFRTVHSTSLSGEQFDNCLFDKLFEVKRPLFRHRRAETTMFVENPSNKQKRIDTSPSRFKGELSLQSTIQSDVKKDLRQKVIASLQSYLTKSYQSYRSNFQTSKGDPKETSHVLTKTLPSDIQRVSSKAPTSVFRPAQEDTGVACTFVDYYVTHPDSIPKREIQEKKVVRKRRFFTISVGETHAKEGKPSASTQCSGNSHFGGH